ncbi:MAG: tetratricopeptide repeat protein, partial [Chthoniobacterales bacterium]
MNMRNNRRMMCGALALVSVLLTGTSWAKKGDSDKEAAAEAAKAVQLAQKGAFDLALQGFTKAIAITPKDERLYRDRGGIYLTTGKFQEAVADFSKAIEMDAKDAEAYSGRGAAEAELNQFDQAMTD